MSTPATSIPPAVPRGVLVIVGFAAVFIVVGGLRQLSDIIGPTFLALVLTVAAQPVRPWIVRRGLPVWVGTLVALVSIYAVLLALALSLAVAGARFASLVPAYEEEFKTAVTDGLAWLESAGVDQEQIDSIAASLDLDRLLSAVGGMLSGLLGTLSSLFFVVTLVLFMVVDATSFTKKAVQLPAERLRLLTSLDAFAKSTRTYLIVSTVFGLIVAVIDTLALVWIGVPLAAVWGLLAFITNYIPNIGFVIGVIPPAVIGLLEGGASTMITVVVVYCAVNLVIQTVIQPRVVGEAVGLSPTLTMLSLAFWAYALGAIGALMAVPLTLLAKALLVDADPRSAWVSPLLSASGPAPVGELPTEQKRPRHASGEPAPEPATDTP